MRSHLTCTVVIATYNGASYIEEQLRSIASQTRPPDHVVVSDDGSTDRTLAIVHGMAAEMPCRMSIREFGRRVGAVGNFERALGCVNTDVVLLSDQDDLWVPEKVAVLMDRFERVPSVGGVFTNGSIISDDPELRGRTLWDSVGFSPRMRDQWASDPLGVLLRVNVVTGASLAFRSELLPMLLPFPTGGWHDLSIAVVLASLSTLEACPQPLIAYRVHGSNAAGVPSGSRRSRVVDRRNHLARLARQEWHWTELKDRLMARGAAPETVGRIDAKLGHLARRRTMPDRRFRRLVPALRELTSGGYGTYAAGNWSLVRDVVGP